MLHGQYDYRLYWYARFRKAFPDPSNTPIALYMNQPTIHGDAFRRRGNDIRHSTFNTKSVRCHFGMCHHENTSVYAFHLKTRSPSPF